MFKKQQLAVAAVSILTIAGLAACSSSSGTATGAQTSAAKSAGETVVIGYENNGAVDPTQAAQSLGYWQKDIRAHVKMVYFSSGPAALTALASGAVNIMTGIGNPPVASALANGIPLAVIWCDEDSRTDQALVVRKSANITSVQQLKGKTVATVDGSTSSYALTGVLRKAGLPTTDVNVLNLTPPAIATAWKTRTINAAYIWYPVLGQLLANGGVELANDANIMQSYPINNLSVVNKNWASSHKQLVDEFIQAQSAGVQALRDNLMPTLKAELNATGETLAEAQLEAKTTQWFTISQQLSPDALGISDSNSLVAKSLITASQYSHSLDPSTPVLKLTSGMINRSFVIAAGA